MRARGVLSLCLLLAALVSCETPGSGKDAVPPVPSGRRLRDIVAEKFPDNPFMAGVACGLWAFDYPMGSIVDREFGYVTPENDFKQSTIHPDNGTWNFANADIWIERSKANGQLVRMHSPVGPQVSKWAMEDNRTAGELERNMTEFLTAVCDAWADEAAVVYMDVVNETVIDGAWFGPKSGSGDDLWENPWPMIGFDTDVNGTPLYIKKAFAIANARAPRIRQLYNHHEGPENSASWNLIKETVLYLRASGLRVDAIGWQAHVDNGWATPANLDALRSLVDWAHGHALEFHVTEASSFIKTSVTPASLDQQAATYAAIYGVLLEKSAAGTVGWNTWHLSDAYTYRSKWSPSLFDANGAAKPAYYAIQGLLEGW